MPAADILIPGYNHHLPTSFVGLTGNGPDNVIGLITADFKLGDAKAFQQLFQRRELSGELGRRFLAATLVILKIRMPERFLACIECDHHMGRFVFLNQAKQRSS